MKKTKDKPNPLFIVAADNYRNEVLSLRKGSTYKVYSYILAQIVEEFGDLRVQSISKQLIQKYLTRISYSLTPDTVRHHCALIRGVMENADDDWELSRRIKLPKKKRTKQDVYTVEEVQKLIKHSTNQDRCFIMFLFETGCRIGEAVALKSKDVVDKVVNIDKNIYEGFLQDTPKTDSSVRKLCISNTLDREIFQLKLSDPESFIFRSPTGRPLWPQTFTYTLKDICKKAGVTYKSFHAFRRGNVTTLLLDLKIPENIVGMRSGHLSGSMLLGVYCQPQTGQDKEYISQIEQLLYLTKT